MPKTDKTRDPIPEELPGTLRRSPETAHRTFAKVHDRAVETYGEGDAAHRTAYSALKHTHEKRGDHWEPKAEKGPSDPRADDPMARERSGSEDGTRTFGGVDVRGNSRKDLYERARKLDVQGRSKMTKEELAEPVARKQD